MEKEAYHKYFGKKLWKQEILFYEILPFFPSQNLFASQRNSQSSKLMHSNIKLLQDETQTYTHKPTNQPKKREEGRRNKRNLQVSQSRNVSERSRYYSRHLII